MFNLRNTTLPKRVVSVCAAAVIAACTVIPGNVTPVYAVTHEDTDSIKPDGSDHITYHDLTSLGDNTWSYDSTESKKAGTIEWKSATKTLTIRNIDLEVTNKDASKWLSYFQYGGTGADKTLKVELVGTSNLTLNGNVCFIQTTNGADVSFTKKTDKGMLYAVANPVSASQGAGGSVNECHFIESAGDLSLDNVSLSVITKGDSVHAYTNIYAHGNITLTSANLYSDIEASSSNLSCNAVATAKGGKLVTDADSSISAKCNVPDQSNPFTVNNALLTDTWQDSGACVYLTNVNGHPANVGTITLNNTVGAASASPQMDAEGKSIESVKIDIDGTEYANNIKAVSVPAGKNVWFYSENAYVTDSGEFLATKDDDGTTMLDWKTKEGESTAAVFTHANTDADYPDKAKTIMSNREFALTASSADATGGVSYGNGDTILSIKGDMPADGTNKLFVDGQEIDLDEWEGAIRLSNEYTAIKLEGGSITASQKGVYYYIFSKDFLHYLGPGEHRVEIRTPNGIITTTITGLSGGNTGTDTGNKDAYGTIISVTKNEAGDTVYTYDTGTVRVVGKGNGGNTIVTWSNGDTFVTRPDGTSTLTQANGSVVTYDKNGNVTGIYNAGGSGDITFDPNGGVTTGNAQAMNLAITSVSNGYKRSQSTEETVKSARTEAAKLAGDKKSAQVLGVTDITLDGAKDTDGKYRLQLNLPSVRANDNIILMHYKDNKWEQITPSMVGNGYVVGMFNSFSPVAVVRITDAGEVSGAEAVRLDSVVSALSEGFVHTPATDTVLNSAGTYINRLTSETNGKYTLYALTRLTKTGTADSVTATLSGISGNDSIKVITQQNDGSWKEITGTTRDGSKVTFKAADIANGNTGFIKVTDAGHSGAYTVTGNITSMTNTDMKDLILTINTTTGDFTGLTIDGVTVPSDKLVLTKLSETSMTVTIPKAQLNAAVGSHTVKASFKKGDAIYTYTVIAGGTTAPGNTTYSVSANLNSMSRLDMKDLVITVNNAPSAELESVTVDGSALSSGSYANTASGNNTVVTIRAAALPQTTGTHTVALKFKNGTATRTFTVTELANYSVSGNVSSMTAGDMKDIVLTIGVPYADAGTPGTDLTVSIDGTTLPATSYSVASSGTNSTAVTINRSALPQTAGNHTITVQFKKGSAVYSYTVTTASANDNASAKELDAVITAINSGYSHAAVSDSVLASLKTELDKDGTYKYTPFMVTRITKNGSPSSEMVELTIPVMKESMECDVFVQQNDGSWTKPGRDFHINDGSMQIAYAVTGNGNVAVAERSVRVTTGDGNKDDDGSGNSSNGNKDSGSKNDGNSSSGNGSGSSNGSGQTSAAGGTQARDNEDSQPVNTNEGSENSSSESSKQTKKSVKTGQDPLTMFITYILYGLGLK